MLVAAFFITTATHQALPKAEAAMVVAIQKRDVTLIRKLMKKQMTVFTIMRSPNEAKFDLSENYLVTGNQLDTKSSDQEIKIGLERLSKLIESTKQPAIVKSLHNDLTAHTIRGTAKPEDVWEIHYDIQRDGSLVIQRICEFDHTPLFRW